VQRDRAGDRTLYVCHRLHAADVADVARLAGLSIMDLRSDPPNADLARGIRLLVHEALAARRKRATRRAYARDSRKQDANRRKTQKPR
jgi:hypothetical protein